MIYGNIVLFLQVSGNSHEAPLNSNQFEHSLLTNFSCLQLAALLSCQNEEEEED